jgi:hypothetical protein
MVKLVVSSSPYIWEVAIRCCSARSGDNGSPCIRRFSLFFIFYLPLFQMEAFSTNSVRRRQYQGSETQRRPLHFVSRSKPAVVEFSARLFFLGSLGNQSHCDFWRVEVVKLQILISISIQNRCEYWFTKVFDIWTWRSIPTWFMCLQLVWFQVEF